MRYLLYGLYRLNKKSTNAFLEYASNLLKWIEAVEKNNSWCVWFRYVQYFWFTMSLPLKWLIHCEVSPAKYQKSDGVCDKGICLLCVILNSNTLILLRIPNLIPIFERENWHLCNTCRSVSEHLCANATLFITQTLSCLLSPSSPSLSPIYPLNSTHSLPVRPQTLP